MNRTVAVVLVLGLLALGLVALWSPRRAPSGAERSAPPSAREEPAGVAEEAPNAAAAPSTSAPAPNTAPAAQPAADAPAPRPVSTIRMAFDTEPRDATASNAEAHIHDIFMAEPSAQGMLRAVRCTRTVCRIDARWSKQLNRDYSAAMVKVINDFSKEVEFVPDGPPDGLTNPVSIYIRRPQH